MTPTPEARTGSCPSALPSPRRLRAADRLPGAIVGLVAAALPLVGACSFDSPKLLKTPKGLYQILNSAPYADDATIFGERWRVIDAPELKVDHGFTCASAPHGATNTDIGVRLQETAPLPSANWDATVLLNGWDVQYIGDDHHVLGLGSTIFNIARNSDGLFWEAGGVLSDRNGDDPYRWCYDYTILSWLKGPQHIDMSAVHADAGAKLVFVDRRVQSRYNRVKQAGFRAPTDPRARLLTGFGVTFDDTDHHLLQFGFDLAEAKTNGRRINWGSRVILKDNSHRRYGVGHLATVLTGSSVSVWKPTKVVIEEGHPQSPREIDNDLVLTPRDDVNVCLSGPAQHIYHVRVDDVPFDYAVPMLTGWDVGTLCDDEEIKHVGAWIEDWSWHKNPGDPTGTLRYTVRNVTADKDPDSPTADGFQIEVLGIAPR
ncbi:MAG TPA: hypothetical protein VIS07_21870 [Candidatus Binatia bacterium]